MRYVAFFAVALFLIGVGASQAQQLSSTSAGISAAAVNSSSSVNSAPETMTPLQTQELHAAILMARKEYLEAVHAYQKILEGDPNDAEVLNRMGIAYEQLQDFRHAERCYKNAIRADKRFSSAINNLGTIEYDRRHYSKAVKYYNRALAADPAVATVYSNLGYAYFDERKFPEAMGSFGKALSIDPALFEHRGDGGSIVQQRSIADPARFHYFLAKSYALMGDAEHAAHFLKMARDEGYKKYVDARRDPAFAKVIKDPRVVQALETAPAYAADEARSPVN